MTTLFFVPPDHFQGDRLILPQEEARHAVRVLRHRAGDDIEVVDGAGKWYRVRLDLATGDNVSGTIRESREDVGEPDFDLTIALGLLKNPNRLETFVEKAVELGVRRFIPLESERSERARLRVDRLERIAIAAMKQCGRSRILRIDPTQSFADLLHDETDATRLICHETSEASAGLLNELEHAQRRILIAVGPEGGFSEEEVAAAASSGFRTVNLGPRRLRAETAGIAAASAVSLHFAAS